MVKRPLIISSILGILRQSAKCLNIYFSSCFILQTTCPRSSVTPTLAGPGGRRPPDMWRSRSRSPAVMVASPDMCHGKKSRSKILKVPHQVYNSGFWVPKVPRQVYISGSWVPKVPCQVYISGSWVSRVPRPVYPSGSKVPKVPCQVYIPGSWVPKVP